MSSYPVRSVRIPGVTARAFQILRNPMPRPDEVRTVKEATELDKASFQDGDEHHCPLCNEFFGSRAFKAHAQQCIDARAPRGRIWTPPGFSTNAVQHYAPSIKPDFAVKRAGE